MSALVWDGKGQRTYHAGVSKVVLYPNVYNSAVSGFEGYMGGVAWNGVTAVNDSPDGAEPNDFYADNIKYASLRSAENAKGSISAYNYPSALNGCDGRISVEPGLIIGQQSRNKRFGLCYRTEIGDDVNQNAGYLLHLLYGVSLTPSEKSHETKNENPDLVEFNWDFDASPIVSAYDEFDSVEVTETTYDNLVANVHDRIHTRNIEDADYSPNPSSIYRTVGWVAMPVHQNIDPVIPTNSVFEMEFILETEQPILNAHWMLGSNDSVDPIFDSYTMDTAKPERAVLTQLDEGQWSFTIRAPYYAVSDRAPTCFVLDFQPQELTDIRIVKSIVRRRITKPIVRAIASIVIDSRKCNTLRNNEALQSLETALYDTKWLWTPKRIIERFGPVW